MKSILSLSLAAFAAAAITANAETYTFNTPAAWRQNKAFRTTAEGIIQTDSSAHLTARNAVSVDPEKTYKISLKVRLADKSKPSQVYLLAMPITEEGRTIQMYNCTPVMQSDAVLTADCKKSDTSIVVKPKSLRHWSLVRSWRVQFNSAEDLSDLPNFEVSSNLQNVEKNADGTVKVSFRGKVQVDAKAGTPVRLVWGGSYMYIAAIKPTAQWTEISGTVKGISAHGWSNKIFPVGTASFAPALLANWGTKGAVIEIKDFKVEEL